MNFKKLSFYMTHLLYPFLIYGCFFVTSAFIHSQYLRMLREYELVAARDVQLLLPIPILLAFYSSARTLIAYDFIARDHYFSKAIKAPAFLGRLKDTVLSYEFWVGAVVTTGFVCTFASNYLYRSILDLFFYAGSEAAQNRLSCAIFVPVSLLLLLLAHISARKHWWQSKDNSLLVDILSTFGMLLLAAFAYSTGTIMLMLISPLFSALFHPEVGIPVGIAVIVLIGWGLFLAYGRALLRRRKLLKKLRILCETKGFDITTIAHPYRSLFHLEDGASFTITAHGKTYTCKFLSSVKHKKTELHFYKDGACRFVRIVRFGRKEAFRLQTDFIFDFEGKGKKLLIIDPMPRAFLVDMGQSLLLTTGDKAWSYKIFSAEGFLGNLDRDCLDR
ncbi:MAG: hypothetical protein IJY20_05150 [Clostridia bacterium]|nr:hypothetical protein [Clostridia bacterium]